MFRKLVGQLGLFAEPHLDAVSVRQFLLHDRAVAYRFERRRRRTLGIAVDEQGLRVVAPLRAPLREVEDFLRAKAKWILAKLDQWAARGKPHKLIGATGEALPLFGREVTLRVVAGPREVQLADALLLVRVPDPEAAGSACGLLKSWLRAQALEIFSRRAAHYAARLSLPPPPVALSNARMRWGACSARGRIRLSWRLVHLEPSLADYVIAHEVAHLRELNHSRRFWALVETLYPDCRAARKSMRLAAATVPLL